MQWFYDLVSKVAYHNFCFILFIGSISLNLAHTQVMVGGGEGSGEARLLKGRVSNNLWTKFKTSTIIIELLRGLNEISACECLRTLLGTD